MKASNHCLSSVKYFGGRVGDYHRIHAWFDESKDYYGDIRHRALRHHTQGVQECEKVFGITITNSNGKEIPVRSTSDRSLVIV